MINKAEYLGDYKLRVYFNDGQIRCIDLFDFLTNTPVKMAKPFLNKDLFSKVKVEYGTVCWGDNELDINPVSIYYGEFESSDSPYLNDIKEVKRLRKEDQLRKRNAKKKSVKRAANKKAEA